MFKRLGILTILIVLALVGSVPAVTARGGPPEHVERGQALVTGSVWVANDIHITFNARLGEQINPIVYHASGHVHWFEAGEKISINISAMAPVIPYPGISEECVYIGGAVYASSSEDINLGDWFCFQICPDEMFGVYVNDVLILTGAEFLRGNVVIKK